jgi:hypothetical protein
MALHFRARAFHAQIFGRQVEALAALEADGERLAVFVQAQFGQRRVEFRAKSLYSWSDQQSPASQPGLFQ